MRPWLELLRISNLPTVWSNLIAGAVFASAFEGRFEAISFTIVLVAGSCLYLAGMVLNDVFDAAIDARERPGRPIPSGRISKQAATIAGWGLLAIGAGLPWVVSILAGAIGVSIAVLVVFYELEHLRTASTASLMGLCRWGLYLLAAAGTVALADDTTPGVVRSPELGVILTGVASVPVLIHVRSFSMIARGEIPNVRPACPTCGQIVLDDATVCPECGSACDVAVRVVRVDGKQDGTRGWWCAGTMSLLLPFLGCSSLTGWIASTKSIGGLDALWPLGVSLFIIVLLGWYVVATSLHLARHPQAVGRFVLRSIAALSLFDAGLVLLVVSLSISERDGAPAPPAIAAAACLACFALTRLAHRRIAGT
jgi:hypothetical protein